VAEVIKTIVDVDINTGNAASQLKVLQQQINAFNLTLNKGNVAQLEASKQLATNLANLVNSSKFFTAEQVRMRTAAGALDDTLRKGQATLAQYFSAKYLKQGALFAETLDLSRERARAMQTQFVATAASNKGFQDSLAIRPLAGFTNAMTVNAEKAKILSNMYRQGTVHLIDFGKNVQWAGRQLMVGFTVPLTIFGTTAGRTFMDLEKQVVAFKKVYGDLFTTPAELNQNLDAVKSLAEEYTKYGVAVKDTVALGAQAAAAGRRNRDLTDAVTAATRLATLGQMEQNQALDTTIALQSAFRLSGQDLADTINFLNMVENQTVVSLQDLSAAIPRVAPVIQGLGGDVKDMAVFLAAMQEGGVSAEQGANALKSGLGSLINPTKQAKEMLAGFNVNLDAIIQKNRGDLMGTVMDFARALQTLDEFSRQQALEQVFGKFQYARLGALFENIVRDGSQASQVMDTMKYSSQELASTAERELKTVQDSFGVQLIAAMEKFKLAIAPIGQLFVQMAIPLIQFVTKIAEGFNNLPDFQKKFLALATVITGLVIPAGTMFFGLLMNLTGTLARILQFSGSLVKGFGKGGFVGALQNATQSMKYMSLSELDAANAAKQLGSATDISNAALLEQVNAAGNARAAITYLTQSYQNLIATMLEYGSLSDYVFGTGVMASQKAKGTKGPKPQKRNKGGEIFTVPGYSNGGDVVPAMLTPGEFVINKDAARNNMGLLMAINGGKVNGYRNGGLLDNPIAAYAQTLNATKKRSSATKSQKSKSGYKSTATGTTGAHIGGNINFSKAEWNLLYGQLVKSKQLSPKQLKAFEEGQSSGWKGWRMTGGMVLDIDTWLNKALNTKNGPGVPVKSIVDNLEKRFNGGGSRGPYDSLLRNANIQPTKELRRQLHEGVIASLNNYGINKSINDSKLYEIMDGTRGTPGVIENIFKASGLSSQDVSRVMGDLRSPKEIRTGSLSFQKQGTKIGAVGKFKQLKSLGSIFSKYARSFNMGGIVPGTGNRDTVPAMLPPGSFVVNKKSTNQNMGMLRAIAGGAVPGYEDGGIVERIDAKGRTYYMDTQTGRRVSKQTYLSQQKPGSRLSGLRGSMGSIAMGAAFMAPIAGQMMAGNSNSKVAGVGRTLEGLTPVLFGLSALGPILPKLVGALGFAGTGVGAAAIALGVGLYAFNKSVKTLDQQTAKLHDAMFGSEAQLTRFSDAMGRQSIRQQTIANAALQAGGPISAEAQQYSTQFMQSDAGAKLIEDARMIEKAGGDAIGGIRNQLSRAMVAGLISAEEAKAIAKDLGIALNNENLAVGIIGKIGELYDSEGNLIVGNLIKLNAEINATVDPDQARKNAEAAYEESNFAIKALGDLVPAFKESRIQAGSTNEMLKSLETGLSGTADSVIALRESYKAGDISQKTFESGMKTLRTQAQGLSNKTFNNLGVSIDKVSTKVKNLSGGKSVFDVKFSPFETTYTKQEQALVKSLQNIKQQASTIFTSALGKESSDALMNTIMTTLAGNDAEKAAGIFSGLVSGTLSTEIIDQLLAITYDPKMREFLNSLKLPKQDTAGGTGGTGGTFGVDDTIGTGQKSKLQLLKESAQETIALTKAQIDLVKRGYKPEIVASLDAATALELNKSKRKDLIKILEDQLSAQKKIQAFQAMAERSGMTAEELQIEQLDARVQVMDSSIAKLQKGINEINRQNELDQRQISEKQRSLDELSKKEKEVNSVYDKRVEALNNVEQANQRIEQQRRNQIALASSLTSGDFAAAATAAGQFTADAAAAQIEDTRSQLELQRQREIESLTVSVNGQLLTRQQIESQIEAINERIYQRNLNSITIQDQIFVKEQERENYKIQIEELNAQIDLARLKREQKIAEQLGISVTHMQKLVDLKNQYISNTSASKPTMIPGRKFGGFIRRMFGGATYRPPTEPAPGMRMAFGNVVPGVGITDKVPALLTPGEFVVRKSVAERNMPLLNALNSNVFPATSSFGLPEVDSAPTNVSSINAPVYNTYSVNVNVADTNASPNEIADAVINKIKMKQDRFVRSNRF
jgi:TP901 family phage tail tape measure protein